jgi:hypothetical protein
VNVSFYYPTKQPSIAMTTLVRLERRLPFAGEVTVRLGARVEPDDVVARTLVPGKPMQIDLTTILGVNARAAARLIRRRPGEQVQAGDTIAGKRSIGSRQVRAPAAAVFSGYDENSGVATLTPMGEMYELDAHLKGIVMEVFPNQGVSIETPAAIVRGIWGMGGERHGVLKLLVTSNDEELTPELIDAKSTFAVLVGGSFVTAVALRNCIANRVRGVIVGSMPAAELHAFLLDVYTPAAYVAASSLVDWPMGRLGWQFPPAPLFPNLLPNATQGNTPTAMLLNRKGAAADLPFTLIVTEGFGRVPMSERAFELLAAADGQEVAISGATRLRGGLARPEVIIPLPRSSVQGRDLSASQQAPTIHLGSTARVLSGSYLGRIGKVSALPPRPQLLPSGILARAAELTLTNGTRVLLPLLNLEVLE